MDLIPYYYYCILCVYIIVLLLGCDFSGTVSNGFNDTRLQLWASSFFYYFYCCCVEYIHIPRAFVSSRLVWRKPLLSMSKRDPWDPMASTSCCYTCTPFFFIFHLPPTLPSEVKEVDDIVFTVVIVKSLVNFSILYRQSFLVVVVLEEGRRTTRSRVM